MRTAKKIAVSLMIGLSLLVSATPALATKEHVFRSAPRTFAPDAAGEVMTRAFVNGFGGVHARTSTLLGPGGAPAQPSVKLAMSDGKYLGYLVVTSDGQSGRYDLDYGDLVPMALFVDSGGTGLYTYWDQPELQSKDVVGTAGMVVHRDKGFVALEFSGTRFEDALPYIDLCQACLGRERPDVVARINKQVFGTKGPGDLTGEGSKTWLNTDLGLSYGLVFREGRALVDENIVRLYWRGIAGANALEDHVAVTSARQFVPVSVLQSRIEADQEGPWAAPLYQDGHKLFATLALLRAYKASASKADWDNFMKQIKGRAAANPAPWDRYSRAFCTAYEDAPECRP